MLFFSRIFWFICAFLRVILFGTSFIMVGKGKFSVSSSYAEVAWYVHLKKNVFHSFHIFSVLKGFFKYTILTFHTCDCTFTYLIFRSLYSAEGFKISRAVENFICLIWCSLSKRRTGSWQVSCQRNIFQAFHKKILISLPQSCDVRALSYHHEGYSFYVPFFLVQISVTAIRFIVNRDFVPSFRPHSAVCHDIVVGYHKTAR